MLFEVHKFLDSKQIPKGQKEYSLLEYGPLLQEWINQECGADKFRLICYNKENLNEPAWVNPVKDGTSQPLIIFYSTNLGEFSYDHTLAESLTETMK